MNKVQGNKDSFALVRQDASRVIVSYGYEEIDGTEYATWYEVYFYKKKGIPTLEIIKSAVLDDINSQTDEKILSGFVWNNTNVWLSEENQINFSEAQHVAVAYPESILPVTFKIGEQEDGTPIYHTFETTEELTQFYLAAVAFKQQCLIEGWQRKDSIDWSLYENALNPTNEVEPNSEE